MTALHLAAALAVGAVLAPFTVERVTAQQATERARDVGVPLDGTPGPLDAITDVRGVTVGHATIIRGEGRLTPGKGPVRTGVTAIFPRGRDDLAPVFAGWFSLNGNGEMTGTAWLDESGVLEGPVMITNTHSVGLVRDAVIAWRMQKAPPDEEGYSWSLPIVAETADDDLNDMNGFHVRQGHVFHALDSAHGGAVEEGSVGGGTGMICNEFKGGIGTSSRVLPKDLGGWTVGVLVQCNYGRRSELRIAGVPVGREIPEQPVRGEDIGSIIIVVATDAPLLPHQIKRLARRAALGLARDGSFSGDGSGDLFIAFSTANPGATTGSAVRKVDVLPNRQMNPLFLATVRATEEAIVNAMVAADTMKGANDLEVLGLPHERLRAVLKKYNRLAPAP